MNIGKQAYHKSIEIHEALESGKPMDDEPVYRKTLRLSEHYRKIREEATGKPIDPQLLKRVKISDDQFYSELLRDDDKIISTKRRVKRKLKMRK